MPTMNPNNQHPITKSIDASTADRYYLKPTYMGTVIVARTSSISPVG